MKKGMKLNVKNSVKLVAEIQEKICAVIHEPWYYGYGPGSEEMFYEDENEALLCLEEAIISNPKELETFEPAYWREESIIKNVIAKLKKEGKI